MIKDRLLDARAQGLGFRARVRAAPRCRGGGARAGLRAPGAAAPGRRQGLAAEAVRYVLELVCDSDAGARQRLLQVLVRRIIPHLVRDVPHAVRQGARCTGV